MLFIFWLLNKANNARYAAKAAIDLIIFNVILLIAGELIIAGLTKSWMSPWVAIFGIFWIICSGLALWFLGGWELDTIIVLKGAETEPGITLVEAIKFVFSIEAAVVAFAFFLPVWGFWSGVIILPLLFGAVLVVGNLAKKPMIFLNYLYQLFIITALLVIAIMIISALFYDVRGWDKAMVLKLFRTNPLLLAALLVMAGAAITKKKTLGVICGIMFATWIFLAVCGDGPKASIPGFGNKYQSVPTGQIVEPGQSVLVEWNGPLHLTPERLLWKEKGAPDTALIPSKTAWPIGDASRKFENIGPNARRTFELYIGLRPGTNAGDFKTVPY
ncbi:MAG: hypothetical protein UU87_C0001G0059 [Parcubacteria group bacterium GW2011_GWA2_42_11]|nr:MAG: hypothetical protein UU87_C0001G0059 [Parcubacteria group bacterium GW2011_GWA2_42_11]